MASRCWVGGARAAAERWAEGALSAAKLRDVFKARASSARRREVQKGGRRWVLVYLERRVGVGMRDKAVGR
jgi:hypothetical protein